MLEIIAKTGISVCFIALVCAGAFGMHCEFTGWRPSARKAWASLMVAVAGFMTFAVSLVWQF